MKVSTLTSNKKNKTSQFPGELGGRQSKPRSLVWSCGACVHMCAHVAPVDTIWCWLQQCTPKQVSRVGVERGGGWGVFWLGAGRAGASQQHRSVYLNCVYCVMWRWRWEVRDEQRESEKERESERQRVRVRVRVRVREREREREIERLNEWTVAVWLSVGRWDTLHAAECWAADWMTSKTLRCWRLPTAQQHGLCVCVCVYVWCIELGFDSNFKNRFDSDF